jgi:pantoate--beta-alanine ligase
MEIVTTLSELRIKRAGLQGSVGFVPTMGYLHAGHISLAKRAKTDCESVAASIFVNPTQFAPTEDLAKYPRNLPQDLALLEEAGVDLVWTPTPGEMYPAGYQTWVSVETLTSGLEGAVRPAHFRGVTTVVAKLFNAVRPDKAYFGQKDAQQAAVIRQMVKDLNFPIDIVVCPIVREPDGLAMSSRNVYLNADERRAATILFKSLNAAKLAYNHGERTAEKLRKIMSDKIGSEPLAKMQYVSCADCETLKELEKIEGKSLLSMAVYFGKTRLIDNVILDVVSF